MSAKYLAQLLDNKQFAMSLSLVVDNYQTILIQSWFRISFLLPASGELRADVEKLNGYVRRLPRMAELAVQCSNKLQSSGTEMMMILEFLLMISANHQSVQVFFSFHPRKVICK